jgi:transposase
MMWIELTEELKRELIIAHKKGLPAREADKIKAILMLADGYSGKEVAKVLLLDEDTITNWKERFLNSKSIKDWLKDSYTGYQGKLSNSEKAEVSNFIDENIISSCERVVIFLKEEFGKEYSLSGCWHLLHSLKYVYKYTKNVPSKMNAEQQEQFKLFYEDLIENLPKKQVLLFGDSVHPQHNTAPTKIWVKKGQEKVIKSNTGRDKVNISGLYDAENIDFTYVETKTNVNSETFIELLGKVEKKYPEKDLINIIIDNSKTHYSNAVKDYLKEHPKINLIFIPPYSPNLNLIERLWKFLRKKVINTTYYEKLKDFRENILDFLDNITLYSEEIKKFVGTKLHLMPAFST